MKPWRTEMADQAWADLEKLPHNAVTKVAKSIRLLARDPSQVDIKKLEGSSGFWRMKVGEWRVIFLFNHEEHIIKVPVNRKDSYGHGH